MAVTTVHRQIRSYGHARVLVVVRPTISNRSDRYYKISVPRTLPLQAGIVPGLVRYFKEYGDSRTALLRESISKEGGGLPAVDPLWADSGARFFPHLGVILGTVDAEGYAGLKSEKSAVRSVTTVPDLSLIAPTFQENTSPPANARGPSWPLVRMDVPAVWARGISGEGILIGHLDTGIDSEHMALKPALSNFAHFDLAGDLVPDSEPHDSGIHGTHTAGIIAGREFNGVKVGVAPGARLASAIVVQGGDILARVLAGLDWCISLNCRIVNMSVGIRGYDNRFLPVISALRQRGILPVAAAGNDGPQSSRSPGNYSQVISVGACDQLDRTWSSSASDKIPEQKNKVVPDLVAPGVDIYSCAPNMQGAVSSGTSMAAPHLAGLAALLMEYRPAATPSQIEQAIFSSCRRAAGESEIRANRGMPNAVAALRFL